jgi:hypothetical protein
MNLLRLGPSAEAALRVQLDKATAPGTAAALIGPRDSQGEQLLHRFDLQPLRNERNQGERIAALSSAIQIISRSANHAGTWMQRITKAKSILGEARSDTIIRQANKEAAARVKHGRASLKEICFALEAALPAPLAKTPVSERKPEAITSMLAKANALSSADAPKANDLSGPSQNQRTDFRAAKLIRFYTKQLDGPHDVAARSAFANEFESVLYDSSFRLTPVHACVQAGKLVTPQALHRFETQCQALLPAAQCQELGLSPVRCHVSKRSVCG